MHTTTITIILQLQGNVIFHTHLPKSNFNGDGVKWYEDVRRKDK